MCYDGCEVKNMTYDINSIIEYEDESVIVCRKPAGLPVQSARASQIDLESLLKNHTPSVGVVHRLDQPVEGLLVFGKNKAATAALNRSLASGELKKDYLAVVHGAPEPPSGELSDHLRKDGKSRTALVVSENEPGAKSAVLRYRVRGKQGERSLVEIGLVTGRFHQIRAQMAHHGWPLLGDRRYGRPDGISNPALCAFRLSFPHPKSGKYMKFQVCPEGEAFAGFHNGE